MRFESFPLFFSCFLLFSFDLLGGLIALNGKKKDGGGGEEKPQRRVNADCGGKGEGLLGEVGLGVKWQK